MATVRTPQEELVIEFLAAFSRQDFATLRDLLALNATWTPIVSDLPIAKTFRGEELFAEFLVPMLNIYAPGYPQHTLKTLCSCDGLVFAETEGVGKVAAKGRDYANRYAWAFEVGDGRITAIREYFDTAYAIRTLLE